MILHLISLSYVYIDPKSVDGNADAVGNDGKGWLMSGDIVGHLLNIININYNKF